MIQQVVSVNLPVDEDMRVQKMRIMPAYPAQNLKRISIVTGTHGDELEGSTFASSCSAACAHSRNCSTASWISTRH